MSSELDDFIQEHIDLLPNGRVSSVQEAERRAGAFLTAIAHLAAYKRDITLEKIKAQSLERVVNSQAIQNALGKNITEKRQAAEASNEYIEAREGLEIADNNIGYIKSIMEVFNNAHIQYRQMSRGEV